MAVGSRRKRDSPAFTICGPPGSDANVTTDVWKTLINSSMREGQASITFAVINKSRRLTYRLNVAGCGQGRADRRAMAAWPAMAPLRWKEPT